MKITDQISESLQQGKLEDVKELINKALEDGILPKVILNEGLLEGMSTIGQKFKNNEVFVPDVLIAARAMNGGIEILKPKLVDGDVKPIARAILCTVKGDMHDIGKNLVKMMLEGKGIEVIDLGVNVSEDSIVEAVKKYKPQIVGLSALLTTTMHQQKVVINSLEEAGLRDKVKVMVGGAPVTQTFASKIGADAYTSDAATCSEVAEKFALEV